jgi:hypothetical protein
MIQKEAGDHQLFLCLEKIDEFIDVSCLSPIIGFG